MRTEDTAAVKCPICRHTPCEVLEVGSDPDIEIPDYPRLPRPRIHAICPECAAEFYITTIDRQGASE